MLSITSNSLNKVFYSMPNITINTTIASTRNHQNTRLAINSRVPVTTVTHLISLTRVTVHRSFTIRQGLCLLYYVHHSLTIRQCLHLYYVHVTVCCSFTMRSISVLHDMFSAYCNDLKKCHLWKPCNKNVVNQM
jgi:hypothetical protein